MFSSSTKSPLLKGLLTSICMPLANWAMLFCRPMPAVSPAAPRAAMNEFRLKPRVESAESMTANLSSQTTMLRRNEWMDASTPFRVRPFISSLPISELTQKPSAIIITAPASFGSASTSLDINVSRSNAESFSVIAFSSVLGMTHYTKCAPSLQPFGQMRPNVQLCDSGRMLGI